MPPLFILIIASRSCCVNLFYDHCAKAHHFAVILAFCASVRTIVELSVKVCAVVTVASQSIILWILCAESFAHLLKSIFTFIVPDTNLISVKLSQAKAFSV